MRPSPHQIAIAIAVLAVFVRLAFVAESSDFVLFTHPIPSLDVDLTWRGAMALRKGLTPSFELMALSAPFHVYWTAFWQMILGENLLLHRVLAAVFGALMPFFVFKVAYRDQKRVWPAAIAALLVCFLPGAVLMDTRLMKTSLEMGLVASLLLLVPSGRAARSGAVLGVLFLSQVMTVFLWVPVFAYWGDRKRILAASPALALALVAFFLAKSGDPPRFLPQGGVEIYLGNHPESRGYYTPRREFASSPIGHVFDARMAAEAKTREPMSPSRTNAFYLGEAWYNATSHPATTALLWLKKLRLFFNHFEPPSEDYLPRLQERFWLLRSPLGFGVLVWLAAFGVFAFWTSGRRRIALLYLGVVLAVLAPSLLTFISWRFRLPAVPALAVLAAGGLIFLVDQSRYLWRKAIPVGLGAGLLAFYPVVSSSERAKIHEKLAINERLSRAAASRGPSSFGPRSLMGEGRHSEAYQAIAASVPAGRDDAWKNGHYVKYLCWLDQRQKALDFLSALRSNDFAAYSASLRFIPEPYRTTLGLR